MARTMGRRAVLLCGLLVTARAFAQGGHALTTPTLAAAETGITGFVRDAASGSTLPGLIVCARALSGPPHVIEACVERDGRYRLEALDERAYLLRVIDSGRYRTSILAGIQVSLEHPGTLRRDLVVDAGEIVEGIVVDADGEPVANAVIRYAGPSRQTLRTTQADDHGHFIAFGCRGPVCIQASSSDTACLPRILFPNAFPKRPVRIALSPAGALCGNCRAEDGVPLTGVVVRLNSERAWSLEREATSDEGGRFHFSGLAPGRYFVNCPQRTTAARLGAGQQVVDIVAGRETSLTLETASGSGLLTGIVCDGDGRPLTAARIQISSEELAGALPRGPVMSGAQGEFEFDRLSATNYVLTIDHVAYAIDQRVVAASGPVRISLERAVTAAIRVTSGDEPLGEFAWCWSWSGAFSVTTAVDVAGDDGRAFIPRIENPRAGIVVRARGYADEWVSAEALDRATREPLSMVLTPRAAAEIRICDADGSGIRAWVFAGARPNRGQSLSRAITASDIDGRLRWPERSSLMADSAKPRRHWLWAPGRAAVDLSMFAPGGSRESDWITLERKGTVVVLTAANGIPMVNVRSTLTGPDGDASTMFGGLLGDAMFEQLARGRYELRVSGRDAKGAEFERNRTVDIVRGENVVIAIDVGSP